MSLDLSLKCKCCGYETSYNYTYNVSAMWYAVCPSDEKMVFIDDLTGKESQSKLENAITTLKANPEKFRAMNPTNGWGSYHGFVKWLETLLAAAQEQPNSIWSSYR